MSDNTITHFNLDHVFKSILKEKSVVVLGPNFYADAENGSHQKQLLAFFETEKVPYKRYYKEDGFFLFNEDHEIMHAYQTIEQFYHDIAPNERLRKIARIPFHIYLTVTPDKLLHQTFEELKYRAPQLAHYTPGVIPQSIDQPTKDNPLIYNAFGILDDPASIILTHDDLYQYFKSTFSATKGTQHNKVTTALRDVQNIIFLGVPFEKWYMHLFLREFGVHENKKIIRFAADQSVSDEVRTFCYQQFKIHFIEKNITEFIEDLYYKFKHKSKLRDDIIRQKKEHIENLKTLIRTNRFDELIKILNTDTAGTPLEDEVISLESRYRDYEQRKHSGVLSVENQGVESAQIRSAALALINKLEKL